MISEAELRRCAGEWSIDPMIVDLDYVLGCFLSQWYQDEIATQLLFKGGTCLKKCYFPDYRFSEDLDFTAKTYLSQKTLQELMSRTIQRVDDVFGIDIDTRQTRFEVVSDDYGFESYQVRLYYRGPLRWRGDPRAIRLDISRGEYIGLPEVGRKLIHPYGDRDRITGTKILCYDLAEMLAEKLRALGGQRRYAISRDLYDLHQIISSGLTSLQNVKPFISDKFAVKNIKLADLHPDQFIKRRDEFKRDWEQRLNHLLPLSDETSFDLVWETSVEAAHWLSGLK